MQTPDEFSSLREVSDPGMQERSGGLSVPEMIRVIRTRRKTVLLTFLVVASLSILYAVLATKKYEGVARLDIDPNRSSTTSLSDTLAQTLGDSEASTRVQTEMAVMQSESVLLHVAQKLDLAHRGSYRNLKSTQQPHLARHNSELSLQEQDAMLTDLQQNLKINVAPGTTLVEVHFRSPDPLLASAVPNAIVDAYIEQDLGASSAGEERVAEWLASEMRDLRAQAAEAQTKLAEFQRANKVIGIDESQNILVDRLRLLNQQLTDAQADLILKESLYRVSQTHDPKLLASLAQGATLQILRSQQVDIQSQYNQIESKYGAGYPRLQELSDQLAHINADIRTEGDNIEKRFEEEYLSSKRSEDDLRANFEGEEQAFYKLNEGAAQFAMLRHDATSTRDLYDALQYKLKEAGISETLKSTMIRIVDNARQPVVPVAPKVPMVLAIGLFLGVFGGIGLALAMDSLDDSIRASMDVEAATRLPVLAAVPHITFTQSKRDPGLPEAGRTPATVLERLPVLSDKESAAAESYRQLRASVQLSLLDTPPRILLISSAYANEGKSVTSANYALALALRGSTVLLIDADLRRGTLHQFFQISNKPGLTNALSHTLGSEEFPRPIAELPNFAVLPTGARPPNPSEVLSSHRMSDFLKDCLETFDYVIMDSAPILPVADSHALAVRADAVILIARAGITRKRAVLRVKELLGRTKSRLLGIVVNDVNMRIESYYIYGGGYGYGYNYPYKSVDEE